MAGVSAPCAAEASSQALALREGCLGSARCAWIDQTTQIDLKGAGVGSFSVLGVARGPYRLWRCEAGGVPSLPEKRADLQKDRIAWS